MILGMTKPEPGGPIIIMIGPISAIRANSFVPTYDLSYLAFGTFTKRATAWPWDTTPIFVFAIFVAGWRDP